MSKIFRTDIQIWATAYVRAETEEEALVKLRELGNRGIEVADTDWSTPDDDVETHISGRHYSDPDLPELSLSPFMTIAPVTADAMDGVE
ncbi:hypothetical protein [Rhizobium sp. Leaf383]|uniref:hypothetical protein n=1 Tax=Rhizobium sp. Leaf383 TaxID=1736357 RepID=UPI0007153FEB|nr:hypothetical protein [Rhizobium sp. Leaf383]KQS84298.1 hypothetical protein ASG58_21245 [Rhizobium sp. Leaf383]